MAIHVSGRIVANVFVFSQGRVRAFRQQGCQESVAVFTRILTNGRKVKASVMRRSSDAASKGKPAGFRGQDSKYSLSSNAKPNCLMAVGAQPVDLRSDGSSKPG
jgi:hypothetical protein